jgi:hypothetical protein
MARMQGGRSKDLKGATLLDRLEVTTFSSMTEALESADSLKKFFGNRLDDDLRSRAMGGAPERQRHSEARAEELVELAIIEDPRLASRTVWNRCEFGEIFDAGLIASEDELPCFERKRRFNETAMDGDPIRIVISTDSKEIGQDTAAAFMATVRIVQQFRPVEVWWQGSWLDESRNTGRVFLVPLVQGDTDFTRLEFCVSDPDRDRLSHNTKNGICLKTKKTHSGQYQATHSYLDGSKFVDHEGIRPYASSIAYFAASWLDMETIFHEQYEQRKTESAGLQSLPEPSGKYEYVPPTKEEQEEWAASIRERKKAEKAKADERLKQVASR